MIETDTAVVDNVEFRAVGGSVRITDNRDCEGGRGSVTYVDPRKLRERVKALAEARLHKHHGALDNHRRFHNEKLFTRMHDVERIIATAEAYGNMFDAKVLAFKQRHRKGGEAILRRMQAAPHPGLLLPALPTGRDTGRHCLPDSVGNLGGDGYRPASPRKRIIYDS